MPQAQQGMVITDSAQINPGVIEEADIADDAITGPKVKAGEVESTDIKDGEIVNADINASAAIVDTKLAQITTADKVSGTAITLLPNIPAGAGIIPAANVPSPAVGQLSSPARSLGTTYQNTTGNNLIVYVTVSVHRGSTGSAGNHGTATAYMDSSATPTTIVGSARSLQVENAAQNQDYQSQRILLMFLVPDDSYYKITATTAGTGSCSLVTWREQEL